MSIGTYVISSLLNSTPTKTTRAFVLFDDLECTALRACEGHSCNSDCPSTGRGCCETRLFLEILLRGPPLFGGPTRRNRNSKPSNRRHVGCGELHIIATPWRRFGR